MPKYYSIDKNVDLDKRERERANAVDSWVLRTLIREVVHTFIVYREDDDEQ